MYKKIAFISLTILYLMNFKSFSQIQTLSGKEISVDELDKLIKKQMDSLGMPGLSFALINDGKVVYHRAIGVSNLDTQEKIDMNSIFEAASMSKTVFAYFVLRLVDKKLLDLDTPLYKYLPYPDIAKDDLYKLITARMVLSHTTGFPNWRYFDKRDESKYQYGDLYLKFKPGTQFAYSGEGYHYLSLVIAHLNKLTIQSMEPLFQKEVVQPLHLTRTWFSWNDYLKKHKVTGHVDRKIVNKAWPTSFPKQDSTWFSAAGGLHSEAIGFSTFLIGLMDSKDLSGKLNREMFQEQVHLDKDSPHFIRNGNSGWGLGIAIRPVKFGVVYEHGGNNGDFQSGFKINKSNRNGYVFFTNCDQGDLFNRNLAALLLK